MNAIYFIDGIPYRWKFCKHCGVEFLGRQRIKICSDECRKRIHRRYLQRYERSHDRSGYYRQYHLDHQAERNAKSLARFHAANAAERERRAQTQHRYYMRHREELSIAHLLHVSLSKAREMIAANGAPGGKLVMKVAREWDVSKIDAYRMIATGSFPP